jgi:threonyl-tRNA synthetase
MLVIGEKEMNEEMVAVRRQGKGDLGTKSLEEFIGIVEEEVMSKRAFE